MPEKSPRNATALAVLVFLFAIMGLVSGALVISDPSGAALGLPQDLIDQLPVDDLLPVGIWLFVVWGVLPLILSYGLWRRPAWAWTQWINGWTGMHWSWSGTVALVVLLYGWLAVETYYIGFDAPIQYITLAIALVMTFLCLAPCVRAFYWEKVGRLNSWRGGK